MPGTGNAEPESSTMGDFEQEPLADTAGLAAAERVGQAPKLVAAKGSGRQ